MKAIYKYPIIINDRFTIDLPVGAKIIEVNIQSGAPFIWAIVSTEAEEVKTHFGIRGTGHEFDVTDQGEFIGTFHLHAFVWHLFKY